MVRSWRSDRKLIIATVLLLSAEIVWLLMHLQIVPNPFKSQEKKLQQKAAGYVVKAHHELRKRGLNSLIWENSGTDETLYYFDSVLTLSQSSATLHLNEQTEVHLSENTLVTIEPQSEMADNQIRLKFTRGDLRARNPFASTKIETNEWSLNLNQGSEVSLRQTGQDDFEVEVLKGNLEFEKDTGKQALNENQVLKIENNKVAETVAIESGLKFDGPEFQRIYSYQTEALIPVEWKGEAEKIQITPLGKEKVFKEVSGEQNKENLQLEPGKYTLRLVKSGKISEAKEIEIWQAPDLHLLSPFPRDRVKTNENISFIWSYIPEAKEYKFVITDIQTGKSVEKRVQENSFQFNFEEEGDVQWKVIGIDRDGYEMPAPYANQIYPRHEPLAAPKLKTPSLRVPATSESEEKPAVQKDKKEKEKKKPDQSLFRKYFPTFAFLGRQSISQAFAADRKSSDYEAIFAWEPVPGADVYTIEISSTSDFRSPIISKVTKKTEFIWKQFSLGTYYWRVAAGTNKGRMGVFSDPAKVQLEKLPEKSSHNDGVLVRKKPEVEKALESSREPIVTETEAIFQDVPKAHFDEKRFEESPKLSTDDTRILKESYLFEWSPLATMWTLNGENQLKAKLNGSSTGAAHLQTEQKISDESSYFVDAFYAQYKWKATELSTYPFQEEQSLTDARIQILFGNNRSGLLRGGMVQSVPYIQRKGLEQIEIKNAFTVGPSVYYIWKNSERWKSGHTLSFLAGSGIFAFTTQNHFRYLYYKGESTALSIGLRFQGDFVFYQRSFSNGWSGGLTLGFEH